VEDPDDSDTLSDSFYVQMVSDDDAISEEKWASIMDSVLSSKWIVPLVANGTIKVDTGAKVNLINIRDVKALKERPLIKKCTVFP